MPRAMWPLYCGRPAVEVDISLPGTGDTQRKTLLADTGAGPIGAPFELLLHEQDCVLLAQGIGHLVGLGGAYSGQHRTYLVEIQIPTLAVCRVVIAVGISHPPAGFDGIAGFRFLNRLGYGNFGRSDQIGLEL